MADTRLDTDQIARIWLAERAVLNAALALGRHNRAGGLLGGQPLVEQMDLQAALCRAACGLARAWEEAR